MTRHSLIIALLLFHLNLLWSGEPTPPPAEPPPAAPADTPAGTSAQQDELADQFLAKIKKKDQLPPPSDKPADKQSDAAFIKEVSALPPEEQVKRVIAKLKELNPQMDTAKVAFTIDPQKKQVLNFETSARGTLDRQPITQVWPIRALPKLENLWIACTDVTDAGQLVGLPLVYLYIGATKITDLAPLKKIPTIAYLDIGGTKVTDLSPLTGLKLLGFYAGFSSVTDLSPLKNMPLQHVSLKGTRIPDLTPLKTMPLEGVNLDYKPEYAAVLKSIRTLTLINGKPAAETIGK
jgi:hypothetical protein